MNFNSPKKNILVTGGAGFIGSSLIRYLLYETNNCVLNVDKLTYASSLDSLKDVNENSRYQFSKTDICNKKKMSKLFKNFQPDVVMHLAAESHVDRSIDSPVDFIQTNVVGTMVILECSREYLSQNPKKKFRFHHISTDEVFGSLDLNVSNLFNENSKYNPSSPYSASKASADHLVRAWNRTYDLPIIITNCSNNYGPYQFPEKFIPKVILNALNKKKIPVYGNGQNIRDWLYVKDHVRALYKIICDGKVGQTYNIGSNCEKKNIQIANDICEILDELVPISDQNKILLKKKSYKDFIVFDNDRPGHDLRYAINPSKLYKELNWKPQMSFREGLKITINWYIQNIEWCKKIAPNEHDGKRLGLLKK
jgi:dTDP-glucose 4,6-dehydratase